MNYLKLRLSLSYPITLAMHGTLPPSSLSFSSRAGSLANTHTLVPFFSELNGWGSEIKSGLGEGLVATCVRVKETWIASASSSRRFLLIPALLAFEKFWSALTAFAICFRSSFWDKNALTLFRCFWIFFSVNFFCNTVLLSPAASSSPEAWSAAATLTAFSACLSLVVLYLVIFLVMTLFIIINLILAVSPPCKKSHTRF